MKQSDFENIAKPVAKKLIEYAMEKGKTYGITDVRIAISNSEEQENSIENNAVSETVSGTRLGVSVTVFSGDKSLSFSKNTLDTDLLFKAIDDNMQVIHIVPENKDKRMLESEKIYKGKTVDLNLYDKNPPSQKEMIDYAKQMETSAFAIHGIKTAREASISYTNNHSFIMATNGLERLTSKTIYGASISAIAEDDGGMQVDYDYSTARHFADMKDPKEIGIKASNNALAKLNSSLPETKKVPIILSRKAAETFFSSVHQAIDGTKVHRGTTFLKDKIGVQALSDCITMEDDPRIEKGIYSQTVDTSGMESKKLTFIDKGVVKQFNVSLVEARKLGIEPIGRNNGQTNTRILPGTQTKEELIQDIKDGVYIKGFQGGTANVNNGIFSREAYGTLIKDGKITDIAISGFVVSGNLKEMFMNISIADDTPNLPSTNHYLAAPTTRINGTKIAGQ